MHAFRSLALAISLGASIAAADVGLHYVDEASGKPGLVVSVGKGKVRIEDPTLGAASIIDPATRKTTTLFPSSKTYVVTDAQTAARIADTANAAMRDMKQAIGEVPMEGVPPEIQAEMKKMAKGLALLATGAPTYTRTGHTREVGGYRCEDWTVTISADWSGEFCVASADDLHIAKQDQEVLQRLHELARETSGAAGGLTLAATKGVAVRVRVNQYPAQILKTVSTASVPADAFVVPAGFKEEKVPLSSR